MKIKNSTKHKRIEFFSKKQDVKVDKNILRSDKVEQEVLNIIDEKNETSEIKEYK